MTHDSAENSGPQRLTPARRRWGMRRTYAGQAMGGVMTQLLMFSAFGALFIKALGGSDLQAMLPGALIGLPRILQVPVSLLVRPDSAKRFMLSCWWANAAMVAAALVTVALLGHRHPHAASIVLVLTGIGFTCLMIGSTFWFPLLHDIVPSDQRGRYFGKMRTSWNVSTLAAVLAAAAFLGKDPPVWKFEIVLVAALGLYVGRNLLFARLPEARSHAANTDYADWRRYVRNILSRREVLAFCGYFSLLAFCAGFLGIPLVLYMKQKGFPVGQNMLVFGCRRLGMIVSLLVAGALVDRIGTKRVFLLAHLLLCAVAFAVVGIGWLPPAAAKMLLPPALAAVGGVMGAAGVACSTQLFHLAPDRGRAFFMSLSMLIIVAGASVSPLLAGLLSESLPAGWTATLAGCRLDIFQLMLAAAGTALLVLIALLHFVQDVHPRDPGFPG